MPVEYASLPLMANIFLIVPSIILVVGSVLSISMSGVLYG